MGRGALAGENFVGVLCLEGEGLGEEEEEEQRLPGEEGMGRAFVGEVGGERQGEEEEEDCLSLLSSSKNSFSFTSASLCSSVSASTPSTNGFW